MLNFFYHDRCLRILDVHVYYTIIPLAIAKINYSPKKKNDLHYTFIFKEQKIVTVYCLPCLFVTFRNSFKCQSKPIVLKKPVGHKIQIDFVGFRQKPERFVSAEFSDRGAAVLPAVSYLQVVPAVNRTNRINSC